jgi:hydroxyquinol 1,2-dioxygenase
VKESLLAEFKLTDDPERAGQLGIANPFYDVEFDFALARSSDTEKSDATPVI